MNSFVGMNHLEEIRNVPCAWTKINSDRAGRSPELLSVLSTRSYPGLGSQEGFPGSFKKSEICEDNRAIIFFYWLG